MTEVRLGGVILAAGQSRRMGRPKPFLELGRKSFFLRIAESMCAIGADPVVIVANPDHRELYERSATAPVLVWNAEPERGMMLSLQLGLKALPADRTHAVFCPVDIPGVRQETWAALAAACREHPDDKLVVECDGKRGHPVLLPRSAIGDVLAADAEESPRAIVLAPDRLRAVSVTDPCILADVDTPEDFGRLARARPENAGA